jgi:Kef-type K+ transport system membrane component KefB
MVETGLNKTELGKVILAACFVTDLGTVLALGIVFANFNVWLLGFAAATAAVAIVLPRFVSWFFAKVQRVSEPEIKLVLLIVFLLGGIATSVGSEAVLPAYIVGMVLAPTFQKQHELAHRMRVITFAVLTPFYFLKAGSLIEFNALVGGTMRATAIMRTNWRGSSSAPASGVPSTRTSRLMGTDSGCASVVSKPKRSSRVSPMPTMPPQHTAMPAHTSRI